MEDCKGCRIMNFCKATYNIKDFEECPCRICLIKVMCEETCNLYLDWRGDYHGPQHGIIEEDMLS